MLDSTRATHRPTHNLVHNLTHNRARHLISAKNARDSKQNLVWILGQILGQNIRRISQRILFVLLVGLCMGVAQADLLHIQANTLNADEKKGITIAQGNVKMLKGEDKLNADKVSVFVDKNRKPLKFEAVGNVDFVLITEDGRKLKGKSDTLIYLIHEKEYQLIGKAEVQEIGKPNFIKGEKITLNNHNGIANVESDSKAPVRVIIDLNDMQDK